MAGNLRHGPAALIRNATKWWILRSCWSTETGNELWHKSYGPWGPHCILGNYGTEKRNDPCHPRENPTPEENPFTILWNGTANIYGLQYSTSASGIRNINAGAFRNERFPLIKLPSKEIAPVLHWSLVHSFLGTWQVDRSKHLGELASSSVD